MKGYTRAFEIISTPFCSSLLSNFSSFKALESSRYVIPPPGTKPSSKDALVAPKASSTLSIFSLISTSEYPPTLITTTPPESFASLSFVKSLSFLDFTALIWFFTVWILSSVPFPCPPIKTVLSASHINFLILPRPSSVTSSNGSPLSFEYTFPPITVVISCIISVLLEPNEGDLIHINFFPCIL